MNTTTRATIDIGSVENATELIFSADPTLTRTDHRYILQAPGHPDDYLATLQRFPAFQIKRTSEYYIDDTNGAWFAFYNVDCFDPPMAIIRARTFEDAYEVFCDEFEDWIKVEDADAGDYPEDDRTYNGNGTHIDTDNVRGHELWLLTVSLGAEKGAGLKINVA
jgi:hypothetical protein